MTLRGEERWHRVYREEPRIFEVFSRAEDPERRVAQALVRAADLAGRDVLELGCGTGRLTAALAGAASRVVAIEPEAPLLALWSGRPCPVLRARAEALPFRDESFDAVVAAWVVAHLARVVRERAIAEAERVQVRDGLGTWLVESGTEGDFAALRRLAGAVPEAEAARLTGELEFEVVERVETEIVFESALDAQHVLGALLGASAARELERTPCRRLAHEALILRRPLSRHR